MSYRLGVIILAAGLVTPTLAQQAKPAKPDDKNVVTYKDHVAAILRKHCGGCHNPDKATSDLNVTTYQSLIAGGASGEPISPGSPDQSLLYRVVAHLDEPYMPPKGPKIPDADLATIKRWIELGAPETTASAAKVKARNLDLDVSAVSGKAEAVMPPTSLADAARSHTARPHPVTALSASPGAPLLAVSGHECILLYNTDTLTLLGSLAFPERIPHVLKFSRNGRWLLAAGGRGADSGRVVLFDVATGKRLAEIGDEVDSVLAADVSADHKFVALGGPSKIIKIYDMASGQLKHRIKKHTDWVTAMEFSPDGGLLATGDRNGGAYIWEAESGGIVFTLGDHKEAITGMSWRADSQMLATSSEDGRVIVWLTDDGFPTRTINAQVDPNNRNARKLPGVMAVEYSKQGLLATVGRENSGRLWKADGSQVARLEGFADLPSRIVFSHDGQRVFGGDFTGRVLAWNVKDAKPLGELSTNPN